MISYDSFGSFSSNLLCLAFFGPEFIMLITVCKGKKIKYKHWSINFSLQLSVEQKQSVLKIDFDLNVF
jgi:hypothetical protein